MGGHGSGGARANSGPAPDPNALNRRRDGKDWTILPSAGRIGPAPEWPDSVPEPSAAELVQWRTLWAMPQALIWEADRIHDQVALYVRVYIEAMQPGGTGSARTLAKQLQGELLISPTAMMSARYVVAGTNEAAAISAAIGADASVTSLPTGGRAGTGSARDRFKVVPAGPDPSAVAPSEDEDGEDDDVEDDDRDEDIPF